MDRRTILKLLSALWIIWPKVARAKMQHAHKHVNHERSDIVFDQSGILGNGLFVIGAFTCPNPARFAEDSLKLRRRTGYRLTCTHKSRNKWKRDYAMSLIDLWLSTPGARIDVISVKQTASFSQKTPQDKLNQHIDLVSRLVDRSTSKDIPERRIIMQTHYRHPQQAKFEAALPRRAATIAKIEHAREQDSDLMQLVDLVVGAIRADQQTGLETITNKVKVELIKYTKDRLSVRSFSEAFRSNSFVITHL